MTDDLAKLAHEAIELSKHATNGPWHIGHIDESLGHAEIECPEGLPICEVFRRCDEGFIAFARTALPQLAQAYLDAKADYDTFLAVNHQEALIMIEKSLNVISKLSLKLRTKEPIRPLQPGGQE